MHFSQAPFMFEVAIVHCINIDVMSDEYFTHLQIRSAECRVVGSVSI